MNMIKIKDYEIEATQAVYQRKTYYFYRVSRDNILLFNFEYTTEPDVIKLENDIHIELTTDNLPF